MPLHYRVLGQPGRDNALWITVDTGQSQHHLLFDCGEGCLAGQPPAAIQEIELLCFSHFHIDHVAGLIRFFGSIGTAPNRPFKSSAPLALKTSSSTAPWESPGTWSMTVPVNYAWVNWMVAT